MSEWQETRYRNAYSKKAISVFRNIFQQEVYDLVKCDKYMYDNPDVWLNILCGYLPSMFQEIRGGLQSFYCPNVVQDSLRAICNVFQAIFHAYCERQGFSNLILLHVFSGNLPVNLHLSLVFLKEDGDVFDDYDHQMMLHGLGLQNTTTCDSLVAFHKRFKHTLGGKHLLN